MKKRKYTSNTLAYGENSREQEQREQINVQISNTKVCSLVQTTDCVMNYRSNSIPGNGGRDKEKEQ